MSSAFSEGVPKWSGTWGINSVLEGPLIFMMSLEFMEGVLKCSGTIQKIFSHCKFLRNLLAFSFSPIYWWSLLLSPGCYFPPLLLGGFLGLLLAPKRFHILSGLLNSWRDWYAPAIDVLGIIFPAFLSHLSVTKKVSWDILPALQRYYCGGRISS